MKRRVRSVGEGVSSWLSWEGDRVRMSWGRKVVVIALEGRREVFAAFAARVAYFEIGGGVVRLSVRVLMTSPH